MNGKPDSGISTQPEWLNAFPALATIRDDVWLEARQAVTEMIIPAGTTVVRRGDPCVNPLLICRGTLRVYERSENGREISLFRIDGGNICILTLGTLLAGRDYAAEVRTDDEVHAVAIPAALFHKAMNGSEAFRNFIMGTLVHRLSEVMRVVEQVTFQHLDLRLACLLGQLFERNQTNALSTTHEELAQDLGTSRVVISRLLKEFERVGCIRLGWQRIELVSSEALAQMASCSAQ